MVGSIVCSIFSLFGCVFLFPPTFQVRLPSAVIPGAKVNPQGRAELVMEFWCSGDDGGGEG